jgi:hypothetical protein
MHHIINHVRERQIEQKMGKYERGIMQGLFS